MADERTPLLPPQTPPPLPPKPPSPTAFFPGPPLGPPPERPHIHLTPPTPLLERSLSLPALARFAAALSAGHLPSTEQLLVLCDLVLECPLLDDDEVGAGTVWDPPDYGEGRLGTGKLSREGERVRLAAREAVWAFRELVEGRNPVVKRESVEEDGVELVGETDVGQAGDGWQEFIHRCKENELDIHLPSADAPDPTPAEKDDLRASLLSLLHLILTSPALRSLLTDSILLVRDAADTVVDVVEKRDHFISPGAGAALHQVVEGVAGKAVGREKVVEHDEKEGGGLSYAAVAGKGAQPDEPKEKVEVDVEVTTSPLAAREPPDVRIQLNGEEVPIEDEAELEKEDELVEEEALDPPEEVPQVPQKSAEQVKDAFVDRLKEILLQLQSTPSYQRSVHILLALTRAYVIHALSAAKPSAEVHPAPVPGEEGPPTPPETPPSPDRRRGDEEGEWEDEEEEQPGDPTELLIPLLEPFTGGPGSLVPLREAFHAVLDHLTIANSPAAATSTEKDDHSALLADRLNVLAKSLDSLVTKSLLVPGWIGSSESYRSLSTFYDTLSSLGSSFPALRDDLSSFLSLLLASLTQVADDPLLARAVHATEDFGVALAGWGEAAGETAARAVGGEGVATVWGDLVEWVVPRVLGVLREVPLPRIEFASKTVDLAIDPPSLLSTSFIPSSLSIRTSTSLTYLPVTGSSSLALPPSASSTASPTLASAPASARTSYAASTAVEVTGLRLEVKNVGYFARYHTGLPCVGDIEESGLLNLHFGTHPTGGLTLSLATTTPSAAPTEKTLFRVDKPNTHAYLSHFKLTPHHSSHPWLMWAFRPVMRKAVQTVVEREVRTVVLWQGAEWAGRKGWEVREAKRMRELDEEGRKMRASAAEGEGKTAGGVWQWVGAVWDVVSGKGPSSDPDEEDGYSTEEGEETEEEDDEVDGKSTGGGLGYHLHLNRHGLAVDLERGPDPPASASSSSSIPPSPSSATEPDPIGTVGLGTAGVVLPAGSAPIPDPNGPKKGLARAVEDEVRAEVRAGEDAARGVMDVVGEAGEVRDEWGEMVEEEEGRGRYGPGRGRAGWRSGAFDLQ
ncbi:hypothetical protein JCM6882_002766 [Rhodosporidiobolus microsporus]